MWGAGFLLGVVVAFLLYLLVIAPGDRAHNRKRLEIIRKKLARLEERKKSHARQANDDFPGEKDIKSGDSD